MKRHRTARRGVRVLRSGVPTALGILMLVLLAGGCDGPESAGTTDQGSAVPRGYVQRLQVEIDGRLYGFGPFKGYYIKPASPGDFSRIEFVCLNEEQFYTRDQPAGALLFRGTGVLARLPDAMSRIPEDGGRIRPVYPDDQPPSWTATRPGPEYLHFHSLHDATGPADRGYWLRHEAEAAFTYDMGGRVGEDSILHHEVSPGTDTGFAPLVEFDFGPDRS